MRNESRGILSRGQRTGEKEEEEEEEEVEDRDKRKRRREGGDDGNAYTRAKPDIIVVIVVVYVRPPRHDVPIYGTRRNARVRGGNLGLRYRAFCGRLVSSSPRLLAFRPPRLRIRSYIEIVSDISTLSFFPSRLVKYRRCASGRRERRQSGEKETEDLAREEKTVADSGAREREKERERTGGPEGRETVCIKARS